MIKSLGFSKKNVKEELELIEFLKIRLKKWTIKLKNKLFGILKK